MSQDDYWDDLPRDLFWNYDIFLLSIQCNKLKQRKFQVDTVLIFLICISPPPTGRQEGVLNSVDCTE